MTRVKRSAETEAMILDAARGLLAEGGLPALSMRVVAERVGLSATAIYHYFDGKDDLVSSVVRGGYQRFGVYLHEVMEQHPAGSLERETGRIPFDSSWPRCSFQATWVETLIRCLARTLPWGTLELSLTSLQPC